ncbi:MAG: M23 family metallopeptidase [Halanaerobiales bacterium]|nr:M23 family metallopeptidase [Halanaerobiales bacterium]
MGINFEFNKLEDKSVGDHTLIDALIHYNIIAEGNEVMKKFYRKFLGFTLITAVTGISLVTPAYAKAVHKVQSGESLWTIARKHNLDVDILASLNGIYNVNKITVGMELKLEETYKVKSGDSFWSIAKKFGVGYQTLIKYNNLNNPDRIAVGMEIRIPPTVGGKSKVQQKLFIWPIKGRISSYFGPRWGKMHEGIDVAIPIGRNIKAAADGKVVWGGWINGYGYTVIIDHKDGYRTLYGHNSKVLVTGGKWVKQGQTIAKSGNSGRSTGPHLHFEIQKDGRAVDPMKYL